MALQLCSPAHRAPRLSRGHRAAGLLTAAGRGALLLCGTAGSKSGSEIPPESGWLRESLLLYSKQTRLVARMSGQQRQCPSTMRQLPGRRSRLHGKRHFL